jgi:uncharacterized damage-inducible protein DinB
LQKEFAHMNADMLRQFYNYHFAMNRFVWNQFIVPLPQEKFIQPIDYSVGSVRNQIVHVMNVDEGWFNDLRGVEYPGWRDPAAWSDRDAIRAEWDSVEAMMRGYLADLRDDMLPTKPLKGEDADLLLWQVLLHVANHGTDHRAQILRALHDLGVETIAQDYGFYLYDQMQK